VIPRVRCSGHADDYLQVMKTSLVMDTSQPTSGLLKTLGHEDITGYGYITTNFWVIKNVVDSVFLGIN
jgi:hypothetical protein